MEFFGMGMGEILFILVIAMIIWGPGKIVSVGKTLGKMVYTLKKAGSDLNTQIIHEMEEKERSTPSTPNTPSAPAQSDPSLSQQVVNTDEQR